jgi:hypothetical protein
MTVNHTILWTAVANTTVTAVLALQPDIGDAGTYNVQINATDTFGLVTSRNVTFTVYPKVPPPNITNITPWGADNATHDIQTTFLSTAASQFSARTAIVAASENRTIVFNATVLDTRPLTYVWKVNGTQVATTQAYSRAFDFFSAGYYIVELNVSNDRLESSVWQWNLTISNLNRPPQLLAALDTPLTVNGTITYSNYFTLSGGTKFFDPDDDLDSSGALNGNESNSLVFSHSGTCGVATLGVTNSSLTVAGIEVGSCTTQFNATDLQGATLASGDVEINITAVAEGSTETVTVTSSSGGGGGSSSSSNFIPIPRNVNVPKAFNIIAPKLVTIYDNNSVDIPIEVNNSWTSDLKGVALTARSNATGVEISFDIDYFDIIPVNETRDVILTLTNYRLGNNFEVIVTGNVTDPAAGDEAIILLNSIEQSNDGDNIQVKVTFANDLITEHPECIELNEVLDQAKNSLANGDVKNGVFLVDSVINGCKYLVSTQQQIEEKPSRINPILSIDDLSLRSIMIGLLSFIAIASIAFLIYYHYSRKPEDDI